MSETPSFQERLTVFMRERLSKCIKCGKPYPSDPEEYGHWVMRHILGYAYEVVCPDCLTPEQSAESAIRGATESYTITDEGRIVAQPKVFVEDDRGGEPHVAGVIHPYYTSGVEVDWSKRGEYIAKRNLTPEQANEALIDPDRVVIIPDYNSNSGDSARTIGYSPSVGAVLTVITVYNHVDGVTYGANAWKANGRDRRYYQQGGMDDE